MGKSIQKLTDYWNEGKSAVEDGDLDRIRSLIDNALQIGEQVRPLFDGHVTQIYIDNLMDKGQSLKKKLDDGTADIKDIRKAKNLFQLTLDPFLTFYKMGNVGSMFGFGNIFNNINFIEKSLKYIMRTFPGFLKAWFDYEI